jgi:shikimate dehydrogenase
MIRYGLIGYPLSHSFSKQYFARKFAQEGIANTSYELFPIRSVEDFPDLLQQHPHLVGLNVTIPYKQQIMPFLDRLDPVAKRIGAVNTIKIDSISGERVGYNSDYYGFKQSLEPWLSEKKAKPALVLGTGGASKAVICALQDLGVSCRYVSRHASPEVITYETLRSDFSLADFFIIVNTTPLGMLPQVNTAPDLAYDQLTAKQLCYDLVYNPEKTLFMKQAAARGAAVKNGLEMLQRQAEKSWEIWNA